MKWIRRVLLVLALAALGLWLWSVLFPGPEKIIRKRLAALAADVSFHGKEGPMVRAAKIARLLGLFSLDAEITFDAPGRGVQSLRGREDIRQAALSAQSALSSVTVDFLDVNVTLAPDKQSAVVDLTARGRVGSERGAFVQEMKFTFPKIDGKWLIVRVETVRTLSRGGGPLLAVSQTHDGGGIAASVGR
ncbi:MAG: hypothetical protein N3I86_11510 [Verrucomicrobiae bacterium]|nr:hypothetical protein [Verrucomicrobiae bacterium]